MTENSSNPFRPGAGHMPPYLAGREEEKNQFRRLLKQDVILENMVLTGLRGVGKTVLLETLKPIAVNSNWLWVGADLSESTCVSEETTAKRILTDISMLTNGVSYTITESWCTNSFQTLSPGDRQSLSSPSEREPVHLLLLC